MNHGSRKTASTMQPLEPRRLLAVYAMDPTFAGDGTADLPGYGAVIQIVSGGKILTGGNEGVKRLNADGSVDAAFVDRGAAVNNSRGQINLLVGDRVIVAGWATTNPISNDTFFVRAIKASNGDVDTSFGTNGVLYFTPQPARANAKYVTNYLTSLVASPDGTLLLGASQYMDFEPPPGQSYARPAHADFVYKITAGGTIDPTFGGGAGRVVLENDGDGDQVWPYLASVPNGGGKFLVLGETSSWSSALWRYDASGTIDTTFGRGDGISPINPGVYGFLGFHAMYLQPDGKVLLPFDDNPDLGEGAKYLMRVNADGSTDTSFASGGRLNLPTGAGQIRIDPQGRIIGGGRHLFRLSPDGHPDPTFDGDGYVPTSGYSSLALDPLGRLVVGNGGRVARFAGDFAFNDRGDLHVHGTGAADHVIVERVRGNVFVNVNGDVRKFAAADVRYLSINGLGGDDDVDNNTDIPAHIHGGDGADTVWGGTANDTIRGEGGNDVLHGGDGADAAFGGTGDDVLRGGDGNDALEGDAGEDVLLGGSGDDVVRGGRAIDVMHGDAGNDVLEGGVAGGHFVGGDGNDTLRGGDDEDYFEGGAGNDHVFGGDGADALYAQRGDDQLVGGGGADRFYGEDGNDSLDGGDGDDYFEGGAGHDALTGGGGVDALFGLAGNDRFFSDGDGAADTVRGGFGTDRADAGDEDDVLAVEARS